MPLLNLKAKRRNYFNKLIFTEYLLNARHCSKCSKQTKQSKSLISFVLTGWNSITYLVTDENIRQIGNDKPEGDRVDSGYSKMFSTCGGQSGRCTNIRMNFGENCVALYSCVHMYVQDNSMVTLD
jgi:hypothetical protein